MWYILIQIFFISVNVWMAFYHASLIKRNKPIKHSVWATGYVLLSSLTFFVNWLLFVAVIAFRLPVFNTVLNLKRSKPFFYLGKGSAIDRLIAKIYPEVFAACIIVVIVINVILFL